MTKEEILLDSLNEITEFHFETAGLEFDAEQLEIIYQAMEEYSQQQLERFVKYSKKFTDGSTIDEHLLLFLGWKELENSGLDDELRLSDLDGKTIPVKFTVKKHIPNIIIEK